MPAAKSNQKGFDEARDYFRGLAEAAEAARELRRWPETEDDRCWIPVLRAGLERSVDEGRRAIVAGILAKASVGARLGGDDFRDLSSLMGECARLE